MKQLSKNRALIVLLLLIGQQAFSYDFEVNGIYYGYNAETQTAYVTTGNNPYSGVINVPSTVSYNGRTLEVKAIGYGAFRNCVDLISITLHDGIETIEDRAFSGCSGLTEFKIPSSVTRIRDGAFSNCASLQSIHIPNSVNEIENYTFEGCTGLKTFVIEDGEEYLTLYGTIFGNKSQYDHEITIPQYVYIGRKCGAEYSDGANRIDYLDLGISDIEVLSIGRNVVHVPLRYAGFVNGDNKLKVIYSFSTTPSFFFQVPSNVYTNTKVYVPAGSKDAYIAHDSWKNFFQIEEMDIEKMWNGQGEPNISDNPHQQKCEKPIIHYSNGKLSFECATDGATCQSTITDTDIASYSENEIQLSVTYNISVYATALGYQNSEVATATLCWIDADPKTEGIESGVAQVKANAVLIQSHDGTVSVEGVADGTDITIYDTSGQMVGSTKAHCNYTTIATNLRNGSVAIVRIGDKSFKIIMK